MKNKIKKILKKYIKNIIIKIKNFEINIYTFQKYYLNILFILFNNINTQFNELIDLFGIDYLKYKNFNKFYNYRFGIILNLLSIKYNYRIYIHIFINNNIIPALKSIINIWKNANWYEREIYDLYGIIFINHITLNRILTDYNFIGFPFRKDFPMSGYLEIYYNNKYKKICYKNTKIKQKKNISKKFKNYE